MRRLNHQRLSSRTEELPRGSCYPIRPYVLRRAVEAAGLALRFELTFWGQEEGLRADFRPAGFAPWLTEDSFWVRCGAVPSAGAAKAREMLERDAIPRLIEWARGIEALDPASPPRHERQRFFYKLEP